MADGALQNYANHKRFDKIYIGGGLLALPALGLAIYAAIRGGGPGAGALILLALSVVCLYLRTRVYALTVQDRIVRLEMQLRLARILPADLAAQASGLTVRQLVGLRFAADAEMPDLIRRVLAEKIEKGDAIKRLVKDWQSDTLRV